MQGNMIPVLLNGTEEAAKIRASLTKTVEGFGSVVSVPTLGIILVGDNSASKVYVRNKLKAATEIGINTELTKLSDQITEDDLLSVVRLMDSSPHINGILVQLPLPRHINQNRIINAISPEKDVDGITATNLGLLMSNDPEAIVSCTPMGCLRLIKMHLGDNLTGLKAAIVGCSTIVGKPMAALLLAERCTVTMCHVHTENIQKECNTADILVVATGVPNLVGRSWIKEGATVIDVGINRNEEGSLCGDVKTTDVMDVVGAITPVPGGVGPMTVACLMQNTVDAFIKQNLLGS